jgi:ABC-type Fe3+-hydroxamate transport system substrate-binding protein
MKVACLIPSWTETLVECGVNVVGRSRFCIHPSERVSNISIIGGTKDLDFEKLKVTGADVLLLDKEENLKSMKEKSEIPVLVTHVDGIESAASELKFLANELKSTELANLATRYQKITRAKQRPWNWHQIPSQMAPLNQNKDPYERLIYLIWKKPWMSVNRDTYIGSVIKKLGGENYLEIFEEKYPKIDLEKYDKQKTFFLFSSEPFPFGKFQTQLLDEGFHGAIVDGESYSWFGIRSLRFLERSLIAN